MNTRNTERELAALLHRHAEDAMNSTDTQAERERLYEVLDVGPPSGWPTRRLLAVVGTVAAAGVVAAGVWTLGVEEDTTGLPPAGSPAPGTVAQQEREAELLADRVVAAYANHDAAAVTGSLSSGELSWPDAVRLMDRDRAWSVEYLVQPCEVRSTYTNGVMVECVTDMQVLNSGEVGTGPFEASGVFSVMVRDGQVFNGDITYDGETSGMADYLDDVFAWLEENHPSDAEFLLQDEVAVPTREWDRWHLLWQQYAAEHAAEMTSEGNR